MYIISHWDLDGIISAALVVRHRLSMNEYNTKVRLSTINALAKNLYVFLNKHLVKEPHSHLIVLDLNPLKDSYELIENALEVAIDYGIRVQWIDHHSWNNHIVEELKALGVDILLDKDKVTAEIIARSFNLNDRYSKDLVELARDDDLFLNRYKYTIYWRRILRWFDWDIRYRALHSFIAGDIWPEWARGLYGQIHEHYRKLMEKALTNTIIKDYGAFRIAISYSIDQRLHAGEIQDMLIKNDIRADIYIVVYPNAISLRSNVVDVSDIARRFGGGGHPKASGIPLNSPSPDKIIDKILRYIVTL